MIRIVVYTSGDGCKQCELTKHVMEAAGLAFESVDLSLPVNADDLAFVTQVLGYSTVPVVLVDGCQHWAGFQPDAIRDVAVRLRGASLPGQG